jgi:hypothetical protein
MMELTRLSYFALRETVFPMPSLLRLLFIRTGYAFALAVLLWTASGSPAWSAESAPPPAQGYCDAVSILQHELSAHGWAAPLDPARHVARVVVQLNNTPVYEGPFAAFDRPDVVSAFQRKDWLHSGWRLRFPLPSTLKAGPYAVTVQAKLDNGALVPLAVAPPYATVAVAPPPSRFLRLGVLLLLSAGLGLVGAAFYRAEPAAAALARRLRRPIPPPLVPALALGLLFAMLVALGLTGSSLELGVGQSPFVRADGVHLWGSPQRIRSDEWLLMTPSAMAQAHHDPAFPVVNRNLGEEGQNMLIIGMTGVPVLHPTALAKPATWGFFLLPLRQALAWYWWFPLFGCLGALWAVFGLIAPGRWRLGFGIALAFCSSAYVTGWSYWPAYAAFFPAVAIYAAVALLRADRLRAGFGWAFLLGLAFAGFVLVLYPPWQVSLGYLFLLLGLGVVLRDRLYRRFNVRILLALAFAFGVNGLILWSWWRDAGPAILTLANTVYPGQRQSETGGGWNLTLMLQGFTNLITLHRLEGSSMNQSEISSFYYLFPALALLFGIRLKEKAVGWIEGLLLLFMGFAAGFMLVGVPKPLAVLSQWGRVPVFRADLSLGLAYLLLCGALLAPSLAARKSYPLPIQGLAALAALLWGGVVWYAVSRFPAEVLSGFSPGIAAALALALLCLSWWLALGDARKFLGLYLALSLATVLPFHPLTVAPQAVSPTAEFANAAKDRSRVLFANSEVPAMMLLAAGQPVANGIFHYPQFPLWQRLDSQGSQANIYNRYQHLVFVLGSAKAPYYRIERQILWTRVTVDKTHFDFKQTGARVLVAPDGEASALQLNPSLKLASSRGGWTRFAIPKSGEK